MKSRLGWLVLAMILSFNMNFVPKASAVTNAMYVYAWDYALDVGFLRDAGVDLDLTYETSTTTIYALGLNANRVDHSIQYFNNADPYESYSYTGWDTPTWPLTNNGSCTSEWWQGQNSSPVAPCEGQPGPFTFDNGYEYCGTYYQYWDTVFGTDVQITFHRSVNTELNFFTGGDPASTNVRPIFIKMQASAWDIIGNSNILGGSLQVHGYQCDSSGAAYRSGIDNYHYGSTVAAMQNGFSNYNFNVTPSKAYLQIFRGTNITDLTSTVLVGEQIALTCKFVDQYGDDSSIATITNFQWTVPTPYVSNYFTTTPSLLLTDINLTNSGTYFYWYRPATNLEVQCSIVSKGVTMTAKTKFNVIAPTNSVNPVANGPVAVDSNWFQEVLALHFGDGHTNSTPGVQIDRAVNEDAGDWEWLQLATFTVRTIFCPETNWWRYYDTGLDLGFPYSILMGTSLMDSPGVPLASLYCQLTVDASFESYLMFRPPSSGSIWVPLKVVVWGWSGASSYTNGGFQLVSGSAHFASPLSPATPGGFPTWDNLFGTNIVWIQE